MSVEIETIEPSNQKLITTDRLVMLSIAVPLFAVQAGWTVLLLWAGRQLLR
jgi:hypothetical protein